MKWDRENINYEHWEWIFPQILQTLKVYEGILRTSCQQNRQFR